MLTHPLVDAVLIHLPSPRPQLSTFTGVNLKPVLLATNAPETRGSVFSVYAIFDDLGSGFGPVIVASMERMLGSRRVAFNTGVICGWVGCAGIITGLARTQLGDEARMNMVRLQLCQSWHYLMRFIYICMYVCTYIFVLNNLAGDLLNTTTIFVILCVFTGICCTYMHVYIYMCIYLYVCVMQGLERYARRQARGGGHTGSGGGGGGGDGKGMEDDAMIAAGIESRETLDRRLL